MLLQNVIGLDEGTALIGREDSYIVAGRGNVTVVRPCEAEVHGPGCLPGERELHGSGVDRAS